MKLEKRQKIVITLIIIVVAFLGWQLYDMYGGGSSTATAPSMQTTNLKPISTVTQPTMTAAAPSIPSATPAIPAATTATDAAPQTMQQAQVTLEAPLSSDQSEYLQLVNRYEVVKMKRLVTDEEAAIAASQAKIAQLNYDSQKYSGSATSATSGVEPTSMANNPLGYQLMYIDYQSGHWTATLNRNGRFQEVTDGTTLDDGSKIVKIDQEGVVVEKDGNQYLLSFYGASLLSTEVAAQTTTPSPSAESMPIATPAVPAAPAITQPAPVVNQPAAAPTFPVTNTQKAAPATTAPAAKPESKSALPAIPGSDPQTSSNTKMSDPSKNKPLLALTPSQKDKVVQLENIMVNKEVQNAASSESERHLLSLPADQYTLQIQSSSKLSDLTDLIRDQNLQGEVYIYHTEYLNKKLYILVYGVYRDPKQAEIAMNSLPLAVQHLRPWVRTIASVQEAINNNGNAVVIN